MVFKELQYQRKGNLYISFILSNNTLGELSHEIWYYFLGTILRFFNLLVLITNP